MPIKEYTESKSENIVEILSSTPSYLVRRGTGIFLAILVLMVSLAAFIRYPDIVSGPATLNSLNAPKEVINYKEGKLVKILVKENDVVKEKQVVGYCESTANPEAVIGLGARFDSLQQQIDRFDFSSIGAGGHDQEFGELQASYQVYKSQLQQFLRHYANGVNVRKRQMLEDDLEILRKANKEMTGQLELVTEDVALSDENFGASRSLAEGKVISKGELRDEQSKNLNKRLSLPQIKLAIISNESLQNGKLKDIAELEDQIIQQRGIFVDAFKTFRSQIEEWKHTHLLIAPADGSITFATFLEENQHIRTGQVICFVTPGNTRYYAELLVPQDNLGKVRTGQKVLLKFPSYPYQEYGVLEGNISFISNMPSDSGYVARIELLNGVVTTGKKRISYRTGLVAEGEIITHDVSLLQRIYYRIIRRTTL